VIHPAAATFERVAQEYELGRPSYPDAAVEAAVLPPEATVLDLGAGTGKLTRVLLRRFARVIAVEPLDGMRALIPAEAEALAGTAERIPLPDGSIDGVFCGESFHWFDWPAALPEIARVLRPGGPLVLLWNRGIENRSAPWPEEVDAILDRVSHSPGETRYHDSSWRDAFAGQQFEPLRDRALPNPETVSADVLLARIGSWSNFTTLPPDERERLLAEIRGHLTEPSYDTTIETRVWTTRRS
jgi:SAM-dependent methyltransferase